MTTGELTWIDATCQRDLVRRGEVTPRELVEASIDRIERLNPVINAVIHDFSGRARDDASSATLPDGPFRGVPFLVKDAVCHTAGDPFHCGMRVLKEIGWTEASDTWLAARFRAAGLVFCGKSNTPELVASVTTEPLAYGPTRNPWDLTRSTGGSSGGSAAAVASGMVAVAHGNDMGGSIRVPASLCGIVGLKPTRARTTLGPGFGEFWGPLTHEFVLTRSVRDVAGLLDCVAGPGTGDPYTAPAPSRPYINEVGADAGRLRVGFRTMLRGGGDSDPEVVAAVEATARALESLGHDVGPTSIDALDAPVDDAFTRLLTTGVARDLERWSERTGRKIGPDDVERPTALLATIGASFTATDWLRALEDVQAWCRVVQAWWEDHDVLVLPTTPDPPFALGVYGPDASDEAALSMTRVVTFTVPFDLTGQPAISLPLHWTRDGLPVGVQLVAAYGREDVLLRVASQLEQAIPWADRHPALATDVAP